MLHATLNLGILAHVDAGKTTLTERLLFDAGVIGALGSVDRGTTQTDTLELERERGITIRSAVVSFPLHGLRVNLIDTPGHPDFIAEVERVLHVLDGVVLVVSAVEGVQAQTLVLFRALRRLGLPTILFLNKTDRSGADVDRVLGEIRTRLTPAAVALWDVDVSLLAEHDDELLGSYVDGVPPAAGTIARALARQTRSVLVHPVVHGSAVTGTGLDELRRAIAELLPSETAVGDGAATGTVFKIERSANGEKVAYVRMFGGRVRTRDRVAVAPGVDEKVTAIDVFEGGSTVRRPEVEAGEIARLWGLHGAQVGDRLGAEGAALPRHEFAPPAFEAVVDPQDPADAARLHAALTELAEQDPLIGVRRGDHVVAVSLYGEVQKEVLEETLRRDYSLAVEFHETQPIHVERPTRAGEAQELLNAETNPFHAQLGLRVEPAPPGSGVDVRLAVQHDRVPLYAYKRTRDFAESMRDYVLDSLREGAYGWEVVDCVVTVIDSWYSLADGPPSRRGPLSTPGDFRGLTPIVLRAALERAAVVVCEPVMRIRLEIPAASIGATLAAAARLGATLDPPEAHGDAASIEGAIAATRLEDLQRELPGLTHGEGVLESSFAGYRPVAGEPPRRFSGSR